MTGKDWLPIVQAAIARSGLSYSVSSFGCSPDGATCFATVEHQRTKALQEIRLSRDVFPPDRMVNEVIHQLRALNIDVVAPCARGHLPVVQFERDELQRRLRDGSLTFYCAICDAFREPTEDERAVIRRLLAEPPV
jgi:hypothetical protein